MATSLGNHSDCMMETLLGIQSWNGSAWKVEQQLFVDFDGKLQSLPHSTVLCFVILCTQYNLTTLELWGAGGWSSFFQASQNQYPLTIVRFHNCPDLPTLLIQILPIIL